MARKNVIVPHMLFSAEDISTNQTSDETNILYLDSVSIIVQWSGTAPVGELFVEVANKIENDPLPTIWEALDFGVPITVTGASGSHNITVNQQSFSHLRLRYARSSGTGTMNAILVAKQVGG